MPTTADLNRKHLDMKNLTSIFLCAVSLSATYGQGLPSRGDDRVPAQVDLIYERGLRYLAENQNSQGCWDDGMGREAGVVGLCAAAVLAHGEAPLGAVGQHARRRGSVPEAAREAPAGACSGARGGRGHEGLENEVQERLRAEADRPPVARGSARAMRSG